MRGRLDEALNIIRAMGYDPHYNLGGGETTDKVASFMTQYGIAMN